MRKKTINHAVASVLLAAALIVSTGCDGLPYVVHVAQGQFGIVGSTEPIEQVLADPNRLTPEQAEKLQLIVDARQFAVDTMGLSAGNSYTTFYDTEGDPLAFNMSAARRDALEPYIWSFPIVGEVPYLAFFDEDYLDRTKQRWTEMGYDVTSYELDAYSTLGVFEDPVRSTMLKRNELSLAETIVHEILHNTIWRPNATTFNETLANFVGRQGAIEFLTDYYGPESGWREFAVDYYADLDTINVFLRELYDSLDAYYAEPLRSEAKIAGRDAVFEAGRQRFVVEIQPTLNHPDWWGGYGEFPTNNAWMLGHFRYNYDLSVMADVFEAVDQDWAAALAVYQQAAEAKNDPFAFLANWVAEHADP